MGVTTVMEIYGVSREYGSPLRVVDFVLNSSSLLYNLRTSSQSLETSSSKFHFNNTSTLDTYPLPLYLPPTAPTNSPEIMTLHNSKIRHLFPTLPPEIRNEIYAYASSSSQNPATINGLPFATKTYNYSQTSVVICPIHTGNPSLLALQRYGFLEAKEYYSWLMVHAIQIRISVVFKGHVGWFSQKHWEEKMTASLQKLVKKYPWIGTAAQRDVRVLWDAKMESMAAKPGRAAEIVNAMVKTLVGFQDPRVRARDGVVSVRFHIPHSFAAAKVLHGWQFGLETFLGARAAPEARVERREVTLGDVVKRGPAKVTERFLAVPGRVEEKEVIVVQNGRVEWTSGTEGLLVMRRIVQEGRSWQEMVAVDEKGPDCWRLCPLRAECGDAEGTRGV
ncbi:uncharacterized protein EI97DRAFT_501577 [Westerdykella ornata]|uniref:Uncharacterized protein n=1 Tax=Westerdykella ornata TaxID=318751 RepID=A0A6A6JGW4_WESOR|nr:uncharacterized protein EI97DRAFT_501577 [Westerdykella ornata]KAF2275801.1 hypothetical protein EI97DRAFT_501577 [Westerdykella ornata]